MLGQLLVSEKPADPCAYLVEKLESIKAGPAQAHFKHFFSDEDVETLFSMYDIGKQGITAAQCRQALDALGLEECKVPSSSNVFDCNAFKELVAAAT